MGKRIVIALGGNALGNNLPEQRIAVQHTAKAIVDLIQEGHEVVVAHGNGPQVGMIQNAMTELTRSNPEKYIPCPLSVCVAMSQGYIGYDLQNALREEMQSRGITKGVTTVLTQVEVDPADPAFQNPTKPIGSFMSKEEAETLVRERGYQVVEDAGRGYRRVVASPRPIGIVELDTIRSIVDCGHVVIACGGGAVTREENYEPLHQNGVIVFLRRDLEKLSTKGRPLSQRTSPEALYKARRAAYERFADLTVDSTEIINRTADAIIAAYGQYQKG